MLTTRPRASTPISTLPCEIWRSSRAASCWRRTTRLSRRGTIGCGTPFCGSGTGVTGCVGSPLRATCIDATILLIFCESTVEIAYIVVKNANSSVMKSA